MRISSLYALNEALRKRQAAVHVTDLSRGEDWVFVEGQQVRHPMAAEISKALETGKSVVVDRGGDEIFLNAQRPPPVIVIIGAVHISQSLARIARLAGFDVGIIDPRTAFASAGRFKDVDVTAEWPADVLQDRPLDRYTALVAVSHDAKIDDWPIMEALTRGCFYVGALGSRKTHVSRLERLRQQGLTDGDLSQIHAPIGLDIGAANPAEIAVAILAEIIQAARSPMRSRVEARGP
jgi:xanthine dehydrogenase accessory factor